MLDRALAVLAAFSNERPELTLGMIGESAGLSSATAHRLVSELVEWGALQRVGRGRYRIGMRLWQLGSLAPAVRNLRDVALPFLQDLLEVTHEVVHLAVLDGQQALFIERLLARPLVHTTSRVASRMPLHATGPGKVLLAYAPSEFVDGVIAAGLAKRARNTITSGEVLRRRLTEIRDTGYCLSREEITDGAASVAAPVRGPDGTVIAGVSVVLPSADTELHRWVPAVRLAAAGISRAMSPRAPAKPPPK